MENEKHLKSIASNMSWISMIVFISLLHQCAVQPYEDELRDINHSIQELSRQVESSINTPP